MRRVLICGDRRWSNYDLILRCVQKANATEQIDVIIEGEAEGADKMGRKAGEACGIPIMPFKANWNKYFRAAGPIRNQQMLDEGKPTEVWCFHNDLPNSKGTADMFHRSLKAKLLVYAIRDGGFNSYRPERSITK